jgi:hypothetical protein
MIRGSPHGHPFMVVSDHSGSTEGRSVLHRWWSSHSSRTDCVLSSRAGILGLHHDPVGRET